MPRYAYFTPCDNEGVAVGAPEPFDVTVNAGATRASINGPALPALLERLRAWGPGAANAVFDIDLERSTLHGCRVVHAAVPSVLEVAFKTKKDLTSTTG